jgi:hypothetical protein
MKKLLSALLITLIGVSVQAQNKPLACQEVATGGLNWENGRWVTSRFKGDKFILVLEGKTLTKESVSKAIGVGAVSVSQISCGNPLGGSLITCNSYATQLLFDPKTLKGGISGLLGSTMEDGSYKDSIYVQAFSCQPY